MNAPTVLPAFSSTEADPRLLEALASLNQISAAINRIGSGDAVSVSETWRLIVESATQVIHGTSAVIYAYDHAQRAFDPASRVAAGEWAVPITGDGPRPDGLGVRAIGQRRRVLSYEERDMEIYPVIRANTGAKASACFPLIVADQAVGALYMYLYEDRQFSQFELLLLEIFVNQAAMAIYQTRRLANVKRDLARKEDELSRLHRAGLLISSRLRLKETLEAILQMALEVTNAHYGILRLVDKRGQYLINHAMVGERLGRPQIEALPINSKSVMGWVAEHRQPVRVSDLLNEPWKQIYYPLDAEISMRSELAVPLIGASGRLEGVLNLESPLVDAFTEPDSHILQALATQAVVASQEVRLLDALQEVAQLLLALPCHQVLNRLVELACDLLNAAASSIWMLKDGQLALQSASAGYEQSECVAFHRELAGRVMVRPGSKVGADAPRSAPNSNTDDVRVDTATQSIVVPILAGDEREPVGAFCVRCAAADEGRFAESEWDKKVLACLAHYAALAVDNAARQEALRAAQEQRAVAETFAAVGDIAANLLHHLNNKVGTIPVRVQGIQDKRAATLAADGYLAANLAEIERSAREAMEAVHENLSHLHPIHRAPVGVAVCVRDAIANAKLPATLRVHIEGLDQLPLVEAGQHGLTLVFANLLDNAAEAMQGRGVVTIRGAARSGWVNIAVSDTGPGIAPEWHDRIFDFNFSGRARTGKLGFGLWWVKTLMARLGGSVAVESDGVHGTTFRLSLPGQRIENGVDLRTGERNSGDPRRGEHNTSSRRSRADRRR